MNRVVWGALSLIIVSGASDTALAQVNPQSKLLEYALSRNADGPSLLGALVAIGEGARCEGQVGVLREHGRRIEPDGFGSGSYVFELALRAYFVFAEIGDNATATSLAAWLTRNASRAQAADLVRDLAAVIASSTGSEAVQRFIAGRPQHLRQHAVGGAAIGLALKGDLLAFRDAIAALDDYTATLDAWRRAVRSSIQAGDTLLWHEALADPTYPAGELSDLTADAFLRRCDTAQAVEIVRDLPGTPWRLLARILHAAHAEGVRDQAFARLPAGRSLNVATAMVYLAGGHHEQAREVARRLDDYTRAAILVEIADAYLTTGQLRVAERTLQEARGLDTLMKDRNLRSTAEDVTTRIGVAYFTAGLQSDARRIGAVLGTSEGGRRLRAVELAGSGGFAAATEALERITSIGPWVSGYLDVIEIAATSGARFQANEIVHRFDANLRRQDVQRPLVSRAVVEAVVRLWRAGWEGEAVGLYRDLDRRSVFGWHVLELCKHEDVFLRIIMLLSGERRAYHLVECLQAGNRY